MPTNPAQHYETAREIIGRSLGPFAPEMVLTVTICLLFLADLVVKGVRPRLAAGLATGGVLISGLCLALTWPEGGSTPLFGWAAQGAQKGLLAQDGFGWFFKALVLATTLVAVPMAVEFPAFRKRRMGEFYALLLGASLGMFIMVGATNLLMIFLGIEFSSLCSYLLTSFVKRDIRGSEAGLKYVIYGSVAAGVMIFGMSLLYGLTGSMYVADISERLIVGDMSQIVVVVAAVLTFAGFAYKMAAFPMHFWCPDVYQGAPVPVTAYLSVASKAAGFAVFLRFLLGYGEGFAVEVETGGEVLEWAFGWPILVALAAALSMVVGNLAALWQTDVKRLLAYSSIAHAGYLLMGVAAVDPARDYAGQLAPVTFYFVVFALMNLGAFYVVHLVAAKSGAEDVKGYRELGRRNPLLAACLTLFLISLVGIPPTAGFTGKFQLFKAAIEGGYVWLAVVAGLTTAISVYYYYGLIKAMYFEEADGELPAVRPSRASMALTGGFAVLVLWLGLFWNPLAELTNSFTL